jgi:hypothetical protein
MVGRNVVDGGKRVLDVFAVNGMFPLAASYLVVGTENMSLASTSVDSPHAKKKGSSHHIEEYM